MQPSADYGTMTMTGPEKLNESKDTYTITYDADYSMSTNLYEILKSNINDTNDLNYARMIIQLDSKLSVKSEDIIVNSNIFETNGDISVNGNEITINLKLKDGWETQSDTNTSITINAEMANDKFESGKVLAASGRFEASVPVPDSSINVIVPSNAVRTEMVKAEVYEITVSAGSSGTISPSGTISVNQGEDLQLTITPDEGYVISDVIVDGVSQGSKTSYTFENIVSDHSIRAEFKEKSSGSSSSSSSSGVSLSEAHYVRYYDGDDRVVDDKYAYGERVIVKDNVFTAPEGMILAGWSREEGGKVDYIPGDTFRMPDSSVNLYAVWKEAEKTHYAYMSGYPDGTIRPDNTITRAEAAQIFYNLLPEKNIPYTVTFKDVTADKWYYKAVNVLASLNIISGVGDGKFEPERPVSRAEFTAMAMRFGGKNTGGENIFNDVYGYEWFYDDIVSSINYGWIKGYPDGSFRPYNSITRAEAVTVINNMLGRSADIYYIDDNVNDVKYFTDLDKDFWAYYQMAEAANGHTYKNIDGEEKWTDSF